MSAFVAAVREGRRDRFRMLPRRGAMAILAYLAEREVSH
jgi:hypothetical protein